MKKVDVGKEFHPRLTNRDGRQRDGTHTGVEFRDAYLAPLKNEAAWGDDSTFIELDFENVEKVGPSWANEVFAYFTQYAPPKRILKKIKLVNITRVKKTIIRHELEAGYSRK